MVVVAIDDQAAAFNRHLDFDELDDRRLWRRLVDGARGSEIDPPRLTKSATIRVRQPSFGVGGSGPAGREG